ncbi:hypothetical protein CDAR_17691 [Caerostris darwini]|uniref:Secreted protein n=1 Tax=Caerostris darwini TaxID=1538125 RepID=A0AAV4MBQ4_9ARAC|nr:hypothetical protein CDAR_17691 [Caerostris darwini]
MRCLNYKCAFSRCFQFKGFCLLLGFYLPPFCLASGGDETNYNQHAFVGREACSPPTPYTDCCCNLSCFANHYTGLYLRILPPVRMLRRLCCPPPLKKAGEFLHWTTAVLRSDTFNKAKFAARHFK